MRLNKLIILLFLFPLSCAFGQLNSFDYMTPKEYTIAGIVVDGVRNLDHNLIIQKSDLQRGAKVTVPGEGISSAIRNLWNENLFSDVQILADKVVGGDIFLVIKLKERERLSRYSFKGISKSEGDNLREDLDLFSGKIVTDDLLLRVRQTAKNYFVGKGFLHSSVDLEVAKDTLVNNSVMMKININKGNKFKIKTINLSGNTALTSAKIKRQMKDTKEKKWYKLSIGSKFQHSTFKNDKQKIIDKYHELSYRDAEITFDTVYNYDHKSVNIDLNIYEGSKYYIKSIKWSGNLKYTTGQLDTVLGIKPGDEYNQATLDARLYMNPNGNDVSSLYMDDGYLFFQITPIENFF
jgi:outer membrane protein insertion porin family